MASLYVHRMITSYYTLHALAEAWRPALRGAVVRDAFSQVRGELSLALDAPDGPWTLRCSVQAPFHYLYRSEGVHKARRNVATLFDDAVGRRVADARLAERDRMLYVDLEDGGAFQLMLFGPRANVFLTDAAGTVVESFQADAAWAGEPAPTPRAAPHAGTWDTFEARWRADRKTLAQAVAATVPLFGRLLSAEAVFRADLDDLRPADADEPARRALFAAVRALQDELGRPAPHVYWRGRFPDAFGLVPLRHLEATHEAETFDDLDAAVRLYVRRTLAEARYRQLFEPLDRALADAEAHARTSAERMLEELANESRADRYERWGHLLMAAPHAVPEGAEEAVLPDLFEGGEAVIPVDSARSAVENAERYYAKARQTRQARAHAEERLLAVEARADEAAALRAALHAQDDVRSLERFRKDAAERLAPFLPGTSDEADRVPFRRFDLGRGYEVWVGRNAKQNDALTLRHAQKYDLWMHARGVPGSHAVLRLPHRQAEPDAPLLRRAAAIAAYFSKARGSSLVPVMVTPRKYVRKPKGAAPGAVVVEREEVLLVEPGLPAA